MPRLCLVLLLVLLPIYGVQAGQSAIDFSASVYKIRVKRDGFVSDGSAVLIAPGRLLTACHVTRRAQLIEAGREEMRWRAYAAASYVDHDLCVLDVPDLSTAVTAAIGTPEDLQLGEPVIAVGYPRGGRLRESSGEIKGLHAFDGGTVVQVSATFAHGQSGGGLFDASGRLVGIIGFKTQGGRDFNFALPLRWAGDAVPGQTRVQTTPPRRDMAFWQRPAAQRPLFLRAASLEADRDWEHLLGVAQEWVSADDSNPASWLCLGRALAKLGRERAAARAFARAESLLPSPEETRSSSIASVRLADAARTPPDPSASARQ